MRPRNSFSNGLDHHPPAYSCLGEPFQFDGLQVTAGPAPRPQYLSEKVPHLQSRSFDAAARYLGAGHQGRSYERQSNIGWSPLPLGGGIHYVRSQSGLPNRVTGAIVYFDNNGSTMWFLDSTPYKHSEYSHRFLSNAIRTPRRPGQFRTPCFRANIGSPRALDLLTIAKHEIGHALGLSTWNTQWISKNAAKGIRLTSPRPYSGFVIPINTEGHLRLHGALMDRSLLPGQRKLISVIDVLVIA